MYREFSISTKKRHLIFSFCFCMKGNDGLGVSVKTKRRFISGRSIESICLRMFKLRLSMSQYKKPLPGDWEVLPEEFRYGRGPMQYQL